MRLENKVALITGAAQGIGLACAERFAAEGARLVLCDVDGAKGREAAQALSERHDAEVVFLEADVSQSSQVQRMLTIGRERLGCPDIVLTSAAVMHKADLFSLSEDDFDRVLSVNLKGSFLVAQAAARFMVEAGVKGSIITMSSVNSMVAIPNQIPYVVSKGGIQQLTRVLSLALAEHGIRVNAVAPGSIETDMLKAVMTDDDIRHMILSRTPMKRVGSPDEVARVALFLASDDASYVTGETIVADGGRMALNYTVPVEG